MALVAQTPKNKVRRNSVMKVTAKRRFRELLVGKPQPSGTDVCIDQTDGKIGSIVKAGYAFLASVTLLSALSCTGCSMLSPEKTEAKVLGKTLNSQAGAMTSAALRERQILIQISQWSGEVAGIGFPAFQPIPPNARFPRSYEQEVKQILQVWQAVHQRLSVDNHPTSAAIQVYLGEVVASLQQREAALGEIDNLLSQCANVIQTFNQAFSHPAVIDTLGQKVQAYAPPPDKASSVLSELRLKYKLTDADLQ
jgi:hypothetical protein